MSAESSKDVLIRICSNNRCYVSFDANNHNPNQMKFLTNLFMKMTSPQLGNDI